VFKKLVGDLVSKLLFTNKRLKIVSLLGTRFNPNDRTNTHNLTLNWLLYLDEIILKKASFLSLEKRLFKFILIS